MSTEEQIQQTKAIRDVKQAELKKMSESYTHVTADNLEFILKQMEPLRTTIDSLDHIIDSLEGYKKPHRQWREPDSIGHYQ